MAKNNRNLHSQNFMVLEFPSLSTNRDLACTAVCAFAKQLKPTLTAREEIKHIVNEAVENAIIHAYPNDIGTISIKSTILNNSILEITVTDNGRGIENIDEARYPCFTTGGAECSGMGFTVMECFTITMDVDSTPGQGTTVTMKYLISQE